MNGYRYGYGNRPDGTYGYGYTWGPISPPPLNPPVRVPVTRWSAQAPPLRAKRERDPISPAFLGVFFALVAILGAFFFFGGASNGF
jgi:hypothetical protein